MIQYDFGGLKRSCGGFSNSGALRGSSGDEERFLEYRLAASGLEQCPSVNDESQVCSCRDDATPPTETTCQKNMEIRMGSRLAECTTMGSQAT